MDIKVGEYVRTKYGIAKVIRDNKDEKAYFDNYDMDKELDGCNFINDFEILNHSFNIIDLIEVGDYVNGKLIHHTDIRKNSAYIYYGNGKTFTEYQITSVVTKEQFEREKYVVGE